MTCRLHRDDIDTALGKGPAKKHAAKRQNLAQALEDEEDAEDDADDAMPFLAPEAAATGCFQAAGCLETPHKNQPCMSVLHMHAARFAGEAS